MRFIHNHHMKGSNNNKYRPLMERFWGFVDKRGPDDCWEWTGSRHGGGYGLIGINGRSVRTHRFSYEIHKGPIPKGMKVLHTCDNPPCVNPGHLYAGSHQDNMDDKMEKGRHKVNMGEAHHSAKFTEEHVRDIRKRRADGETGVALAKEYGVTTAAICAIFKRKNWKHLE